MLVSYIQVCVQSITSGEARCLQIIGSRRSLNATEGYFQEEIARWLGRMLMLNSTEDRKSFVMLKPWDYNNCNGINRPKKYQDMEVVSHVHLEISLIESWKFDINYEPLTTLNSMYNNCYKYIFTKRECEFSRLAFVHLCIVSEYAEWIEIKTTNQKRCLFCQMLAWVSDHSIARNCLLYRI